MITRPTVHDPFRVFLVVPSVREGAAGLRLSLGLAVGPEQGPLPLEPGGGPPPTELLPRPVYVLV